MARNHAQNAAKDSVSFFAKDGKNSIASGDVPVAAGCWRPIITKNCVLLVSNEASTKQVSENYKDAALAVAALKILPEELLAPPVEKR